MELDNSLSLAETGRDQDPIGLSGPPLIGPPGCGTSRAAGVVRAGSPGGLLLDWLLDWREPVGWPLPALRGLVVVLAGPLGLPGSLEAVVLGAAGLAVVAFEAVAPEAVVPEAVVPEAVVPAVLVVAVVAPLVGVPPGWECS